MEDLSGGVIATSFEVLAGELFDGLDEKLGKGKENKTKVEYIGGSVEAACALGMADGIGESIRVSLVWTQTANISS
jgi:ATP phosphoribosyltransferase